MSGPEELNLKNAYKVETPEDSIKLYGRWADTYDQDFAQKNDYHAPRQIADTFAARCSAGTLPILDVGAGTGLVGVRLAHHSLAPVDAIDISAEMLAVAMGKGCYRKAIRADLTQELPMEEGLYGGVTCAGTFTFGHVGPEAIDALLRVAKPDALFVLGINAKVFESNGFKAKFEALSGVIRDFELLSFNTYGAGADAEMQKALSTVAVFYKR